MSNKIAIIGDLHFGKSDLIDSYLRDTLQFFVMPYLKERKINHIVQLGDVFNSRKGISALAGRNYVWSFLNPIIERGITLNQLLGNHDVFYNNDNELNTPDMFFGLLNLKRNLDLHTELNLINKIESPVYAGGFERDYICVPWGIKDIDYEKLNGQILFCHCYINGFEQQKGNIINHGVKPNVFKNFDLVISGHIHRKQYKKVGNTDIYYVGSLIEMDFGESDIEHGFYILDTDTLEMEFVDTKVKIFEKVIYNENEQIEIQKDLKNKIVKVIGVDVKDQIKFSNFVKEIQSKEPYDIIITNTDIDIPRIGMNEEDEIDTSESFNLIDMINRRIDKLENPNIDKEMLKKLMNKYYNEVSIGG